MARLHWVLWAARSCRSIIRANVRRWIALVVIGVLILLRAAPPVVSANAGPAQSAAVLYGVGFSPYIDGQDPNYGAVVPISQLQARMQIVAPYTEWVRSFGSTHGLENIPGVARSFGLHVAAGAWISNDLAANAVEIANLIANAQAGLVDLAIVGSEALLRNDVSEAQLIAYINQVKSAIPAGIPVATADTYDRLLLHPAVIGAGDVVLPNIYSYWTGVSITNAVCALATAYQQVVAASGGRTVIISEAGWPSAGNAVGAAVPSPANAATFFSQFIWWVRANHVAAFYFEAFDEAWKANHDEGPQGAHWGIWDKDGLLKPGNQPVFNGQTTPVSCAGTPGGPGTPELHFTYVPPYGTFEALEGTALHVSTANYNVALYIKVNGGWWTKPTFSMPLTPIQADGSWSSAIVTGGADQLATDIGAFLLPTSYSPPALSNAPALPAALYANAVAVAQTARTVNAISGAVLDQIGHPLAGAAITLTGAESATTPSAQNGKYSFPNLANTGPYTVTALYPNYTFTPASHTITSVSGNQVRSFSGTVVRTAPLITWAAPANIVVGTPLSATQLNATASVLGTFEYTPPPGTVLGVGPGQTLSVTFTPFDTANYTTATASVAITVTAGNAGPQTLLTTQVPATPSFNSGPSWELGTQISSDVAGQITALRFWKAASETGPHTGHVWSAAGQLLATVSFTNETASGWQQQALPTPVTIVANTPYVVSVSTGSTGDFGLTLNGFAAPLANQHLTAPANAARYGALGTFPSNTAPHNYFRDVVFVAGTGTPDTTPPTVSISAPAAGSTVSGPVTITATASDDVGVLGVQFQIDTGDLGGAVPPPGPYGVTWDSTGVSNGPHTIQAIARDAAGHTTLASLTVTVSNTGAPSQTLLTTQVPATPSFNSGPSWELGTQISSDVAGQITALRFWKAASETGAHTGHLWSAAGQLLATVSFTNETASGWQQQALSTPLTIAANTSYVVSVSTGSNGDFALTLSGFATALTHQHLTAPAGAARYGALGAFPTSGAPHNYFRDIVFVPQ